MNQLFKQLEEDFPTIFGADLRPAPLTKLSLTRVSAGVPTTMSNEERLRHLRSVSPRPETLDNFQRWPHQDIEKEKAT